MGFLARFAFALCCIVAGTAAIIGFVLAGEAIGDALGMTLGETRAALLGAVMVLSAVAAAALND